MLASRASHSVPPSGANKPQWRCWAKAVWPQLPLDVLSQSVLELLVQQPFFLQARRVALYCPRADELNLCLLWHMPEAQQKTWLLPRVGQPTRGETPESLFFHPYHPQDPLLKNQYGILEPEPPGSEQKEEESNWDLLLVPARVVDAQGYRLGFGKGFYDRLLARSPQPRAFVTASLIPEALLVEVLPRDPWDLPVDWILTESQCRLTSPVGRANVKQNS
ncbi:MAG: 5-formyltetrahydrofolate cyclo-ligase [Candidatus Melainabacteria bacterium]|nr:5-formyltetrahydrofolate cyclo-ligase [Candidatus Melainabacteria bacterium]